MCDWSAAVCSSDLGSCFRGGGRDALSYGVSFATTGRTSWLRGATASFLSGIFGLALSLNPLARGCRRNLARSEEHTSELQSHSHFVCRLLLDKKAAATLSATGS